MGQVIGSKGLPKRANLNALSLLGTPEANEYILVSSDNSMQSNGQGNFDCYIIGDGSTAADSLTLHSLSDSTPTSGSNNSITSGAVYSFKQKVDAKIENIKVIDDAGWYLIDSNGNVAQKYDADGIDFAKVSTHAVNLIKTAIGSNNEYLGSVADEGFYLIDNNGNIAMSYTSNGLNVASVTNAFLDLIGISNYAEMLNKQKASGTTYNQQVLLLGDSLTQGQGTGRVYGAYLAELLPSYTIINKGEGGERIQDLMARMNVKFAVTNTDITIPASGSVNIGVLYSELDGQYLDILKQNSSVVNPVMFHGVAGTISQSGGTYTFTRTTDGDTSITAPSGSVLYMNEGMNLLDYEICIIWIGQNGLWDDVDTYVSYIKQLVAALKTEHYIVIPPTNRNYSYNSNTYCYYDYADMNTAMTEAFGDHYLDMLGYLCTDALTDAGITATDDDNTAIADYLVPPSLLYDSVHFTATGYEVIANKIYSHLETLKYI